jgi:hypothetical protein
LQEGSFNRRESKRDRERVRELDEDADASDPSLGLEQESDIAAAMATLGAT